MGGGVTSLLLSEHGRVVLQIFGAFTATLPLWQLRFPSLAFLHVSKLAEGI